MTRAENAAMRKDMRRGKKLTEEQVHDIRAWATLINSKTWIAKRYGVSLRLIGQILRKERWWWLNTQ
jgi:DNA invertase Pin-like site-specific DNA recombinase